MSEFKKNHSFEMRTKESLRILKKYPDKIPIIVELGEDVKDIPDLDKKKYLCPSDLTMGQFVYVIRKRIKLPAEQAIYIFVRKILPPTSITISQLYKEHKDDDGFLYCKLYSEKTFG